MLGEYSNLKVKENPYARFIKHRPGGIKVAKRKGNRGFCARLPTTELFGVGLSPRMPKSYALCCQGWHSLSRMILYPFDAKAFGFSFLRHEVIMLVLSRTEGDGISFPELDLAIQVLKVQGSKVQIGITAAEEIRILRSELLGRVSNCPEPTGSDDRHSLRNRLNAISLAMEISQRHLQRGDIRRAELALKRVASTLDTRAGDLAENKPNTRPPHAKVIVPPTTIHALLVEDNLNEGSLLAEVLRLHDISVQLVQDGVEALLALGMKKPDAVLLDMNMPNFDGRSTLEQIRKNAQLRSIPVFAVTGADREEMQIPVGNANCVNDWFQKPVQPTRLVQSLRQCCGVAN